jgi:glutaconate CoA-transferase subunit B
VSDGPGAARSENGPRTDVQDVSSDDVMIVNAARALGAWAAAGHPVCFVGIGLPSTAANLARRLYDPAPILVYESGCIGSKPTRLPLSIGDGELGATADAVVSVPEIFAYWLQAGRIDVGFLGGAQVDRFANINSTVIGGYDTPRTRLPGAGGAPEIAASAGKVMVIMRQSARAFVDRCDFRSSMGFGDGPGHRERLGLRGGGPRLVVTDLGLLEPDPESCELVMTALHPGITREQCSAATGWPLRFAADLRETPRPTLGEIDTLREIQAA